MKYLVAVVTLFGLLEGHGHASSFEHAYSEYKNFFQNHLDDYRPADLIGVWSSLGVVRSAPGKKSFWQGETCPKSVECQDVSVKRTQSEKIEICLLNSLKQKSSCHQVENELSSIKFSSGEGKKNIFRECHFGQAEAILLCRTIAGSGKVEFTCLSRQGDKACRDIL